MLLFSTILDINDTLTKDSFIQLAIDWNKNNPHAENIIPDIAWNGERNIRFGNDTLWMEINEYRNKNIIAIRYEKTETNGAVWDTDYVMNFDDMRMAIQLDRSYKEDALNISAEFSTPHFIRLLIDGGYVKPDNDLNVLGKPIFIKATNLYNLINVINGKAKYQLPVVYISILSGGEYPVDIWRLAGRLKGVAHLLVQSEWESNKQLRVFCKDKYEYNGAVGVYFPNISMESQRYFYHQNEGFDEILTRKILRSVIQYCNAQQISELYTWNGVNNSLLQDKLDAKRSETIAAEEAQRKAEIETEDVYAAFDDEIKEYQSQIEQLRKTNEALRTENYGLRAKLAETDSVPVIVLGEENELYSGEIKEMVLDAIESVLKSGTTSNSRRNDVLTDIVKSNDCRRVVSEKQDEIKNMLKAYNGLNKTFRQALTDFGFNITDDGKHYKLTFCGDNRYTTALSKTPSDFREGKNAASEIIGKML